MRIKFLSVIVSFICLSVAFSSCLDSDDTIVYSSDASIYAFGLDTIYGRHYKFTIDQIERLIYNKDSLPMGADTLLDRILIDTLSVNGWVTSGSPQDTLLSTTDSLDLRAAINAQGDEGIKLISHAADNTTYIYKLQIRVHKQDPDSLVWTRVSDNDPLTLQSRASELKSILFQDELLLYTSAGELYRHPIAPQSSGWQAVALQGMPVNARISTLRTFAGALYLATDEGELYRSDNGADWQKDEALSGGIVNLIATLPSNAVSHMDETLTAMRLNVEGETRFVTTTDGNGWIEGETVPDDFPGQQLQYTAFNTANGVCKAIVVGTPQTGETATTPWFSLNGTDWAALSTTSEYFCPALESPFITYYGDALYCFGGNMDAIYTSQTGIAWNVTEKKFLLPAEMSGKKPYAIVTDPTEDPTVAPELKRDYLWVITAGEGTQCTVWRGRLNRLGFAITN